jgi:serine/threonine-protein kinase
MAKSNPDRNLLFALVARLTSLITSRALFDALFAWTRNKEKTVGEILVEQNELAENDEALLDSLVQRILEIHNNDARRSLRSVSTVEAVRPDLEAIDDEDLAFSVGMLSEGTDETVPHSADRSAHAAGASSSCGSRFQLRGFYRRGGQGEVWTATDVELQREVALKRLRNYCADDPRTRQRFLYEARVTGALEHRGIAPVYGLGHFENGRPFYAMRFIRGTSLREEIEKYHEAYPSPLVSDAGALELRRLLARFVDVCNTVAFAHSRGVIHRDLKPGNIILDDYGEALVVDWGLAKMDGSLLESCDAEPSAGGVSTSDLPQTIEGDKLGTPAYMSPEQAAGRTADVSSASDVYGLGATLYALLTGKPPVDDDDTAVVLAKVSSGEFPAPRERTSTVPASLDAVCLKAMAHSREDRYASPRALGEEVERWLADQPVSVYPQPLLDRTARWVRHHKQLVMAAGAMLIASLLGLAAHDWQIRQEKTKTADQLAMTRDALRELLGVSGERLALIPNSEGLRIDLAQLVLDRYEQLGKKFPEDTGVRLETAHVLRVIAGIMRLTGQFERSKEAYEKAIQLLTLLSQTDPGNAEYRRWLIETLTDRGELYRVNGRSADAERDYQAAIAEGGKIPVQTWSPLVQRNSQASALIDLAEILMLKTEYASAQQAAGQAVELLATAIPSGKSVHEARARWLLSLALTDRAIASKEAGEREQALHDLEEAAGLARQVPQDDEWFDDMQLQLATISNRKGELLTKDQARLAEADESFEQASGILQRLIKNHAEMPQFREEFVTTLLGRAELRIAQGNVADALRNCEEALEHVAWLMGEQVRKGSPENPHYLSSRGQILAVKSRVQELQGNTGESRKTLQQAVINLSRALEIDPARLADKVKLEELKARSAQSER